MKRIKNRFGILLALKEHRDGRRYSYRAIAEKTGLSTMVVTRYMNNTVKRFDEPVLVALCEFLDCTPGDLLEIVDEKERKKA